MLTTTEKAIAQVSVSCFAANVNTKNITGVNSYLGFISKHDLYQWGFFSPVGMPTPSVTTQLKLNCKYPTLGVNSNDNILNVNSSLGLTVLKKSSQYQKSQYEESSRYTVRKRLEEVLNSSPAVYNKICNTVQYYC